jgi:hypothetical protein
MQKRANPKAAWLELAIGWFKERTSVVFDIKRLVLLHIDRLDALLDLCVDSSASIQMLLIKQAGPLEDPHKRLNEDCPDQLVFLGLFERPPSKVVRRTECILGKSR